MLGLSATDDAKAALRALKESNRDLFDVISERIGKLRDDPEQKDQGRAFRLDDGRTAHLATFYDAADRRDLALVWVIEDIDGGVLRILTLEEPK